MKVLAFTLVATGSVAAVAYALGYPSGAVGVLIGGTLGNLYGYWSFGRRS